ncbi:Thymidylate kinase [Candidatus Sulfobium mesophilum]|uniref:Thymidylate kinase n=1 Tax=Candidatus Sulfobium mesophilum TaxID=2016548 RepID=A0A2U3QL32_9BACT|nr:Thymidylate kinase [Candidatus Sulfobium mesophilum]
MRGIFISIEGIEGTGKSTQATLLAKYLKEKGYGVTQTAEPGGTRISFRIRELLLSPESTDMEPMTELLLYNAARVQHIKEIVMPALLRGEVVITDRFSDSTMAYQGYGRGIGLDLIDSLDSVATGRLRPHLTILLDIDVETGLMRNRKLQKHDRLELEDISFHEKVRKGFLGMAAREQERIRLVDCSGDIEAVRRNIVGIVDAFFDALQK